MRLERSKSGERTVQPSERTFYDVETCTTLSIDELSDEFFGVFQRGDSTLLILQNVNTTRKVVGRAYAPVL